MHFSKESENTKKKFRKNEDIYVIPIFDKIDYVILL